jgi:hypothetical protein
MGGDVNSTFFDTILPSQGLRCIALPRPDNKWHHHWGSSNAWLVREVARLDALSETVYFACASFQTTSPARPNSRRRQDHVAFVRAFWIDMDVGVSEPGKPKYPTQEAAIRAIVAFVNALKLPIPWLVSSGTGLHVYWPMDADMAVEDWKPVAQALKAALTAMGVLFDPSRTADEASVLRPPGATHRKDPANPLPVTILKVGKTSNLPTFAALLPAVAARPSASPKAKLSTANAALGGGMGPTFEPSSAHLIADRCGVIGLMRDTGGKLDQATWYHSLGVLVLTEEAPDICHEWSQGDPRYTAAEVDAKLTQSGPFAPTTCDKLAEDQPDICAACPYRGKITTPLQLGREPATASGGAGQGGGAFGGGTTTGGDPSDPEPGMPSKGYRIQTDRGHRVLAHYVPADGTKPERWDIFCRTPFWPTLRARTVNGDHFYEWAAEERTGGLRTFALDGGVIGKGGSDVAKELGRNDIYIVEGKERAMAAYLKRWMDRLQDTRAVTAHTSFGWNEEGFVTGDFVVGYDGRETKSRMAGPARNRQDVVVCKGSLDAWKTMVDRAYNAPGQEAFQFQLLCGFAAPLMRLLGMVEGVTVYAHSSGSGVGKTTVQRAALSIWGYWREMILAQDKTTMNALWALIGAYNTLPIVYDELTNAKNDEVSNLVFSVSSGRAKERLNQAGEMRDNNSHWTTILLASGNLLLSDKLAAHRLNPDAEISRLFEFTQPPPNHLTANEANDLFGLMDDNYGHAGLVYARFLVKHRALITSGLQEMRTSINKLYDMQPVDRYWAGLFTCVLMALKLCHGLKLLGFETAPLKMWMSDQLEENRGQKTASVVTPEESLGLMMGDLWPNVLVTDILGDIRRGRRANVPPDYRMPMAALVGRRTFGDVNEAPILWLSRMAIRDWCALKRVNYKDLFNAAVALGWAEKSDCHKMRLGTGMPFSTTPVICWKMIPTAMPDAAHTPFFTVVQGGLGQAPGAQTGTP